MNNEVKLKGLAGLAHLLSPGADWAYDDAARNVRDYVKEQTLALAAKDAEIATMRAQLARAEKELQQPHPDAARLDKLPQCFHMLRTGPVNGCDEWWLTYDTSKGYASVREAIDAHKGTPE